MKIPTNAVKPKRKEVIDHAPTAGLSDKRMAIRKVPKKAIQSVGKKIPNAMVQLEDNCRMNFNFISRLQTCAVLKTYGMYNSIVT